MSRESAMQQLLNSVPSSRRDFVKKLAIGTAFVTPLMASFSMDALPGSVANACPHAYPNQTGGGIWSFIQALLNWLFGIRK